MITDPVGTESRDLKAEERRRQILDAATRVIARKGYNGTTMDDIVRESDLSKGTLYWYFKSKKEILLALMERILGEDSAHVEAEMKAGTTLAEQLQALIDYAVRMRPDKECEAEFKLSAEFWQQATVDPDVKEKYLSTYTVQRELGVNLIKDAVARGEIEEVNAVALTDAIISIFDGLTLRWILNPQSLDLRSSLETVFGLILKGLKPSSS